MKKIGFASLIVFFMLALASCGEISVAGNKYQHEQYPLTIEFSENSNKVFYLTSIDTYTTEKNVIIINHNGKEIRLLLKGKKITVYPIADDCSQSKKINSDAPSFIEVGKTDLFNNVFSGTEKTIDGIIISFTENTAKTGDNSIQYNFDSETALYTTEGYEPTIDRNLFLRNCFNTLVKKATNSSNSNLSYEDAFWIRQRINNTNLNDDIVNIYLSSFYSTEYNQAKSDEFALRKLRNSKQAEMQTALNNAKINSSFNIVMPATLGKYDFNKFSFKVKSSLDIPELKSTLTGCKYPIEIRLGKRTGNDINWYSDINTNLNLKMPEDKAADFNSETDKSKSYLIIYTVKPYMRYGYGQIKDEMTYDRMGDPVRDHYVQYYQVESAELYDTNNLKKIGNVDIVKTW